MSVLYNKNYPLLPMYVECNNIFLTLPNKNIIQIPFKFTKSDINSGLIPEAEARVFNNPAILGYYSCNDGIVFLSKTGWITEYKYYNNIYKMIRVIGKLKVPKVTLRAFGCSVRNGIPKFVFVDILNKQVFVDGVFLKFEDWMLNQETMNTTEVMRMAYLNKNKIILQKGDNIIGY